MNRITLTCLVTLCCSGCIIPLSSKVSHGHKHSPEAIQFLSFPETTRDDVIASLGAPLIEESTSRVLLYTWETTGRYMWFIPRTEFGDVSIQSEGDTEDLPPKRQGLFVAYDENGLVIAHEERYIGTSGYREQCIEWRNELDI